LILPTTLKGNKFNPHPHLFLFLFFLSPLSSLACDSFHFAEFGSAAEAKECAAQLNGFQMDKQHTLLVNLLSEFEALEKLPDDADKVDGATADEVRVENLHGWLEDARSVSQYAVVFAGRAEIYWNEQKGNSKAELIYGRDNWTESFVSWSPLGTYFVTMHRQGCALGRAELEASHSLRHVGCDVAQFSPRENYLITFSPQFVEGDNPEDPKAIVVWDVRTGKLLRSFLNGVTPFGWSHDDKYFARLDTDRVQVYETPSMGLHQKKSIAATGVTDFAWSPTANTLAFFTPEHDGQGGGITLLEFPSRRVLRTKALFNVSGAKLHWHPQGHFPVRQGRSHQDEEGHDHQF
jgi:translation initiation factor 3 subunit B